MAIMSTSTKPQHFKEQYPNTCIIIDPTEVYIQKPSNPYTQQECIVEHIPSAHFEFNSDVLLVWKSFFKHRSKKGGKKKIIQ